MKRICPCRFALGQVQSYLMFDSVIILPLSIFNGTYVIEQWPFVFRVFYRLLLQFLTVKISLATIIPFCNL